MNIKKHLLAFTTLCLCAIPNLAFMTERNYWAAESENHTYDIKNVKNVLVLPVYKDDVFQSALIGDEADFNNYLAKHLQDKIKATKFTTSLPALNNKFSNANLLSPDISITERAELAAAQGADAFVIATVKEETTREDVSPETEVPVTLKRYQRIHNGPHGSETINYYEWTDYHYIPESYRTMRLVDIDFDVYNTQGEKIFTMTEDYHVYDVDKKHAYKQLINRFTDSWKNLKAKEKSSVLTPKIKLQPLTTDVDIPDDNWLSLQFYYQNEAEHHNNYRVLPLDDIRDADYYITANIADYRTRQTWHEPSVSTSEHLVHTHYRDWHDRDGKKRQMTIEDYETHITNFFGYYSVYNQIGIELGLVDARTNAVLAQQTVTETGETQAEAAHKALHKFFKEIDKLAKKAKQQD